MCLLGVPSRSFSSWVHLLSFGRRGKGLNFGTATTGLRCLCHPPTSQCPCLQNRQSVSALPEQDKTGDGHVWTHTHSPVGADGVSAGLLDSLSASPNPRRPSRPSANAVASRKPCRRPSPRHTCVRHQQATLHMCCFNSKSALSSAPPRDLAG